MLERVGQISPYIQRLLLITSCILLFSVWWIHVPITELDEALYADSAREMVETHQLIIPQYNYVPFYEKPVLTYWLQAASIKLIGINETAIRLPSGLLSIALVLMVHGFLLRWLPTCVTDLRAKARASGAAFLGSIALVSMPFIAIWAHSGTMDITVTFFTTAALLALLDADLIWQEKATPTYQKSVRSRYLLATLFVALATLTKGPIGVAIPFLIWIAYHLLQRDLKSVLSRFPWGIALPLFILIAVPWYVATYMVDGPNFLSTFLLKENLARFATTAREHHGFSNRLVSLFTYLPVATLFIFPFSAFMLRELIIPSTQEDARIKDAILPRIRRFALVWILVIIGIFSISRTQLPSYIQAIAAGAALLFAIHILMRLSFLPSPAFTPLRFAWARGLEIGILSFFGLIYTLLPIYVLGFHHFSEAKFGPVALPYPSTPIIICLSAIVGLLFQINIWQWTIKRNDERLVERVLMFWVPMCCLLLITTTYYIHSNYQNTAAVGEFIYTQPVNEQVVVYYPSHPQSLVFYAQRKILYLDVPFKNTAGPLTEELTAKIKSELTAKRNILLLTDDAGLQQVQKIIPAQKLQRFGKVLIARIYGKQ